VKRYTTTYSNGHTVETSSCHEARNFPNHGDQVDSQVNTTTAQTATPERTPDMTTVSKTLRAAIVKYIAANTSYGTASVRISRDGTVSAIKDANKTANGPHNVRCDVCSVADVRRLITDDAGLSL
jgi:hypothetical protein